MSIRTKTQIIRTSAGAVEYTIPVSMTDRMGQDITADVVLISLGTAAEPGAWRTPDLKSYQGVSTVTAQMLVGTGYFNPAPDDYELWMKLTDDPEVLPRRVGLRVTVI